MTKSDVDILMEARDTIMDPDNWCQYTLTTDAGGHPFSSMEYTQHSDARRWCALGAAYKAMGPEGLVILGKSWDNAARWPGWLQALHQAAQSMKSPHGGMLGGPASVNDHLGHDAVMEMYDRALRFAKEAQESVD